MNFLLKILNYTRQFLFKIHLKSSESIYKSESASGDFYHMVKAHNSSPIINQKWNLILAAFSVVPESTDKTLTCTLKAYYLELQYHHAQLMANPSITCASMCLFYLLKLTFSVMLLCKKKIIEFPSTSQAMPTLKNITWAQLF